MLRSATRGSRALTWALPIVDAGSAVVRPTTATGTLLGKPVGHKPTLARVGYLPEHHRFPRYLTGRQTLEFFGGLAGVDRQACRRRSAELIDTVGMTAWADQKVSAYSKGMMQRVGLAAALVNDPDLVLLDEPTDGVDPVGRRDIRDVLLRIRDQGKTVFINSHLLSELESVCRRVAIMVGGKIAQQGTMAELTADRGRYEIEVAPTGDPHAVRSADRAGVGRTGDSARRPSRSGRRPCGPRRPTRRPCSRCWTRSAGPGCRSAACRRSGRRWRTCSWRR